MNRQSRYINEFISLKCAPLMLELKLFPNAKEITESMAAFHAMRVLMGYTGLEYGDRGMNVVVVGDGHQPRTGALFALRTAWQVHSVDPVMRQRNLPIKRLTLYRNRIEELQFEFDRVLIVMVHSHATLEQTLGAVQAKERYLITIPCCVPHEMYSTVPPVVYEDKDIWSPDNTVKIWMWRDKWNHNTR